MASDPGLERAKEKGDMYYDQSNATKIERGEAVRQGLWCGMRASGARPWPCQRRCGKWKHGKTRIPRLEGAEADLHVSLFLRVERKVEAVFIAWRYEQI